jgi:hypothetical protein
VEQEVVLVVALEVVSVVVQVEAVDSVAVLEEVAD